ncbi:cbb3-type cytochrome oxidase assembly protein CcoS [Prolixibacteraceae bacterium Z1-6]|uniref:Cbb3-type cytochrome oxidase assembly protein CcoS n=1 Tax=Draconibacterium aestuarii TaxID=2998507 RepID=A0A9X3J5X2_9BACT|nr:cbb3-type cytochrome oxidase assembly protein CcoS [Prolixibacteraceae bacterium Z1-6]
MNIFYLLIGVSLFAALIFLAAFIWAVRTGQFDDNETPSMRILFDDESTETETKEEEQDEQKQTT